MKLLKYQPHKKITYSAGLISLCLLPILCLCWLYKYEVSKTEYAIDITYWDPSVLKYMSDDKQDFPPKRDYVTIDLTGNNEHDKISLQYAHILLNRWKIAKDDMHGIQIHFGDKSKYWTLIEAINVCKAVKLDLYIPYKNNFYAFWNFHPKPIEKSIKRLSPVFFCGTMYSDIVDVKAPVNWLVVIRNVIIDYWAPGIIFIIMTSLTFHNLYRRQSTSL